jgi:hypothetical protein
MRWVSGSLALMRRLAEPARPGSGGRALSLEATRRRDVAGGARRAVAGAWPRRGRGAGARRSGAPARRGHLPGVASGATRCIHRETSTTSCLAAGSAGRGGEFFGLEVTSDEAYPRGHSTTLGRTVRAPDKMMSTHAGATSCESESSVVPGLSIRSRFEPCSAAPSAIRRPCWFAGPPS